jgi:glutathione synthase/RimK-type ligase-like ATP-grasp enzyme
MVFPQFQRQMPQGMKAYAGSMWWIIDEYSMNYILEYVKNNPDYVSFHKKTFAADELFFHMILLNATDEKVRQSIVNDDKRFIKWKDINASHPEQLEEKHLEEIKNSDALFARKFDITEDDEILNLIELQRTRPTDERNQES